MSGICPECARRAWLLERLSVALDFRARDLSRFWSLLELPDQELIEALGGRRRAELRVQYAEWEPCPARADEHVESVCPHHSAYPSSLRGNAFAPRALSVRGGTERLTGMLEQKVVAIVGTRRATDYGMEIARELARGLAASGVTVAGGLAEGIPIAAHSGALEAGGRTLTVTAGGVERCSPAWCAALYSRIVGDGCAISEVQGHLSPRARHWWQPARARTLALLAQLVIVVEAGERPWELACAHIARTHGTHVAAVPGRVSSPASKGANSLLMHGASLVRAPQDALDLLYGAGAREAGDPPGGIAGGAARLEPRLARVLELVSAGHDTPAKLAARGAEPSDVAVALIELELEGLLLRGDGGRYLPSAGRQAG